MVHYYPAVIAAKVQNFLAEAPEIDGMIRYCLAEIVAMVQNRLEADAAE